ncbi:hypothetical protein NHX12_031039, partial [Muraenolepis orangiensis]
MEARASTDRAERDGPSRPRAGEATATRPLLRLHASVYHSGVDLPVALDGQPYHGGPGEYEHKDVGRERRRAVVGDPYWAYSDVLHSVMPAPFQDRLAREPRANTYGGDFLPPPGQQKASSQPGQVLVVDGSPLFRSPDLIRRTGGGSVPQGQAGPARDGHLDGTSTGSKVCLHIVRGGATGRPANRLVSLGTGSQQGAGGPAGDPRQQQQRAVCVADWLDVGNSGSAGGRSRAECCSRRRGRY